MLSSRKQVLLVKTESSYGVDPTPTAAANAIRAWDIVVKPVWNTIDRRNMLPFMVNPARLLGTQSREITFKTEVMGHNSTQSALLDNLFEACGNVVSVGDDYIQLNPLSSSGAFPSVYFYRYTGEQGAASAALQKLAGCRGDATIIAKTGDLLTIEWRFLAKYVATTSAAFPTPTFETYTPLVVRGCTLTYGSGVQPIDQVRFSLGNQLQADRDMVETYGISRISIPGRKPTGSFNPEVTKDTLGSNEIIVNNTTLNALTVLVGTSGSQGSGFEIYCPQVAVMDLSEADRDGILAHEFVFEATPTSDVSNDYYRLRRHTGTL